MITYPNKMWNPFVQLDWHDGIFLMPPPAIPLTGSAAHIAAGVLAMPWAGLGTGKPNGNTVLADGQPVVSQGHQPGRLLIPHLNLFPFTPAQINLMIPFLIITSTNTCAIAAGSVVGPDGPLAVSIFRVVGLNQGCCDAGAQTKIAGKGNIPGPVPALFALIPNSIVVNWGSVHVGFTLGDLVRFIAGSLLNFAVDKVFSAFFKKFQEMYTIKMRPSLEQVLPDGMMKNAYLRTLDRLGLPKVARAANGQFTSISEAMAKRTTAILDEPFQGMLDGVGAPNDVALIDIKGAMRQAASDTTDSLSKWADGKAELIP